MQQRLEYIDMAKAIAIISVVAGHVLLYDLYGGNHIGESSLMKVFGSYHNYLFMFLSGMVSVTAIEKKDIIYDVYKRFRCLIVPALVVGIPYAYCLGVDIIAFFENVWKWGYWYLFVLFALYLVSYPFAFIPAKYMRYVYVLMIPIWIFIYRHTYPIPKIINDTLEIDFIVQFFPYFFVGSIVKRHRLHEQVFSLPVLAVCLVITLIQGYIYDITGRYLINYIITFAEIITIISICRLLGGKILNSLRNGLTYIGRNTLYIYLFHYIALNIMAMPSLYEWFSENGNLWIDILAVIVPTTLAITFSLLVKRLLEKSPMVMKIVFNKNS